MVPNPTRRTFHRVSRFASPLHGVPSPTIRSFRTHSRFGTPLHGVPNPVTWVVPTTSTSSVTLWLCVVVCLAAMRGIACTSHPPPTKNSLAARPIYHFQFNLRFLKAPPALRWSQAPCHSVKSYAPTCAPHVIFHFRCLLESLLNFRSGACRFCATEATTGALPLFACLPCPPGCLAVFLYTFLCLVATTTLALLSELLLSKLDSDDVEDVPHT